MANLREFAKSSTWLGIPLPNDIVDESIELDHLVIEEV